jgi:formimidoylglutamate deiminase
MPAEKGWWADYLYLDGQIVTDCSLFADEEGTITRFSFDPADLANARRLKRRLVIPGLVNGHSHTFQRVIRGRTEFRADAQPDTFWTWREKMYRAASRLEPDAVHTAACMAFLEMALAGITSVGEFHYLHHQPGGTPYSDRNLLGKLIVQAARDVGIRLTLLRTAYHRAGFKTSLSPAQARFITVDPDKFIQDTETLASWIQQEQPGQPVALGVAAHSLRAVPLDYLHRVAEYGRQNDFPLHMHVAEQPGEVKQCLAEHGRTPLKVLQDEGILGDRFTAIHAIHISEDEARFLGRSGSSVCACPTSERNLADGAVPAHWLLRESCGISLGSDSQIQIDLFEDARLIEYHLRMARLERVLLASGTGHELGRRLFAMATNGGAHSLCLPVGELAVGRPADFVAIDLDDPSVAGGEPDALLENLVFSANRGAVREVFVQGRAIIEEGHHRDQETISEKFGQLQKHLWRCTSCSE